MHDNKPLPTNYFSVANNAFANPASAEDLNQALNALRSNGFVAEIVATKVDALQRATGLIPDGSSVLLGTSKSLDDIGLNDEQELWHDYKSVRREWLALDKQKDKDSIRILRSTPKYVVGSAHAVTLQGQIVIASKTGSQLASYVYGAEKVILIIGAQKIVPYLDTAIRRISEYSAACENDRAMKAYGKPTAINSLLVMQGNLQTGREITVLLVKEPCGF